jgi:hypothetical protein
MVGSSYSNLLFLEQVLPFSADLGCRKRKEIFRSIFTWGNTLGQVHWSNQTSAWLLPCTVMPLSKGVTLHIKHEANVIMWALYLS